MSNVIILHLYMNVGDYKCYCEHKNGRGEKNGIMCGMGPYFRKTETCSSNEWCTGPSNQHDSAPWDYNLCTEGKIYSNR